MIKPHTTSLTPAACGSLGERELATALAYPAKDGVYEVSNWEKMLQNIFSH